MKYLYLCYVLTNTIHPISGLLCKLKILYGMTIHHPGTPASSTTKTGCHDIAEILLKVALNTKKKHTRIHMYTDGTVA
jgi:hypothetical protein